jgi:hypothetical protein
MTLLAGLAVAPQAQAAFSGAALKNQRSGTCLDVRGNTSAPGTAVQIFTCSGGDNQKWTSTTSGEIRVTIGGTTRCLDAYDGGVANGTKLIIWNCQGSGNQRWTLNSNNSIKGNSSGRCVDINGSNTTNGTPAVLWDCKNAGNGSQTWTPATTPPPSGNIGKAAPYLYMGWGNPPSPRTVQNATGIRWFTMAFILSSGGCTPAWDGSRALKGGVDEQAINDIRAGGGDIIPSISGYSGNKLGPNCSSADALAGAYLQVIDAYGLKAIDVDIENTDEFESEVVQDRVLGALKIVKERKPGIQTILTFGTTTTGPNYWGSRLITRSKELGANVDVYTIMPFDFGGGADMYQNTVNAANGLRDKLKTAFGWSDDTAYRHMGVSGMNGLSDQQELTSPDTWTRIRDWAAARHLARFTFWSVNRDRPCPGGGVQSGCSGIAQNDWEFTRITGGYNG